MTYSSAPFARSLRRSYLAQRWGNALSLLAIGAGLLLITGQAAWHMWPRLLQDKPALWLPDHGWVPIERQCAPPQDMSMLAIRVVEINGRLVASCQ